MKKKVWLIFIGTILVLAGFFYGVYKYGIVGKAGILPWLAGAFGLGVLFFTLFPFSWLKNSGRFLRFCFDQIDKWLFSLYLSMPGLILIILIPGICFFYSSFVNDYPNGYSGLYALMSQELQHNHFIPPISVPYYASGNVPFAYPPFGFYMAGFALSLGINIFDYLKFIPPFLGILSLVALYYFVVELTNSRSKGVLTILLVFSCYEFYDMQITAAGMVRGWALLFSLLSLLCFLRLLHSKKQDNMSLILGALFLGLTALSHLLYLLFALIFSGLLFLFISPRLNYKRYLLYLAGGAMIAAIWFVPAFYRQGFGVFYGALNSHSNLSIIDKISHPEFLYTSLFMFFGNGLGRSLFLLGISLPGILYSLWKKNWGTVLSFVILYLFVSESVRFLILLAAIMVADLCIDAVVFIKSTENKMLSFSLISITIAILIFNLFNASYPKDWFQSDLNVSVLETANWFRLNSPSGSNYAFLSDNHNLGEWLPFLASRTTLVGHWGSEWKNTYDKDLSIFNDIGACANKESLECINQIFNKEKISPNYLISHRSHPNLNQQIEVSGLWTRVFENKEFVIFQRNKL